MAAAECSISRCSHERRTFRKELQKWSRNVLLLVGLERIAEEITGRRKWRRVMEPLNQLDSIISADWQPDELCFFCNARKQPPPDPASGVIAIDSVNGINGEDSEISTVTIKSEQPLDLSNASKSLLANSILPAFLHDGFNDADDDEDGVIKVPLVSSKGGGIKKSTVSICANLAKRSYTENELQAALRDIQSGKLGTRRAAVLYGIPRSTLRNKVYKLTNGRGRSRQAYLKKGLFTSPGSRIKEEDLELDGLPQLESTNCQEGKQKTINSASESLRQLLKHRMAEKAAEMKARSDNDREKFELNSIADAEVGTTMDEATRQGIAPLISQVFANIHNIALSGQKANNHVADLEPNKGYNSEYPLVPLIPDLIHRLAEERIRIEREKHQLRQEIIRAKPKDAKAVSSESVASSSVILKIPSYKPSSKSSDSASSNQNNSADDAKDHGSSKANDASSVDMEYDSEDPVGAKKAKEGGSKMCTSADSSSSEASSDKKSNSLNGKQKRPKRGRYRNYNRDSLIEAVQAVQRGEMSVHRAGSFYGVPHSTLEYKVKERHLLRPRKRDKLVTIQPNPNRELRKVKPAKQNGVIITTTTPSGNQGASVSLFPPLDFNQLAAANQFFASQMMRKLQEDAIMNADEGKNSRESANPSLFGELIKGGMDQGNTIALIATNTGAK